MLMSKTVKVYHLLHVLEKLDVRSHRIHPDFSDNFINTINQLGLKSAESQSLRSPLTSYDKLVKGDHSILVLQHIDSHPTTDTTDIKYVPKAILKYGFKQLMFFTKNGQVKEERCACVLDFYVHEEIQRSGFGHILFEHFLKLLDMTPSQLAYDRPSPKLISFLTKYYDLHTPDYQPNKFMIYPTFPMS